jgi:F-type H+-transporting ATPase subunit a
LLKQQAGREASRLVPLFVPVFLFILLGNLIGLVPYCFTVTGQLLVTGTFAFSIFLGLIVLGFAKHHLHFLHLFMPKGISGPLLPFLVLIELMSYTIRPFSLAIRLFANMLAGHTLLHILANFVFFVGKHNLPILLLPFTFLLAIATLEVGIAFIQAYVFVILSCIYLNDSLNLH